jgi:transcriptional regulator with XRE-family HTH domain
MSHQEAFANRLRSLRVAADLSIERASELGDISPGFWGEVERNIKEPCLESLYGFAQGLGITVPILLTIDNQNSQDERRVRLTALLDLLSADQLEFMHKIALLASDYKLSVRR